MSKPHLVLSGVHRHYGEGERLVLGGDQCELRIAFERAADVAQLAIDARSDGGLGEARTDRRGDVRRRSPRGYLADGTVG